MKNSKKVMTALFLLLLHAQPSSTATTKSGKHAPIFVPAPRTHELMEIAPAHLELPEHAQSAFDDACSHFEAKGFTFNKPRLLAALFKDIERDTKKKRSWGSSAEVTLSPETQKIFSHVAVEIAVREYVQKAYKVVSIWSRDDKDMGIPPQPFLRRKPYSCFATRYVKSTERSFDAPLIMRLFNGEHITLT